METTPPNILSVLDNLLHTFREYRQKGVVGFDCSEEARERLALWHRPLVRAPETLEAIREDIGDCRRCALCEQRHHIVFGAGNPQARLVFVGEGPGYEEDRQGRPFVGAAGQLLTKIIQAMNLRREDVYICNIIKCRPPGNRNPKSAEIDACKPYLERQLKVIKPELICALGTFAAQTLLATDTSISKLRGEFYDFMGIRILPTYHPAYLLRNPEKKRDVWKDMKKLMHVLGLGD